MQSLHSVCQVPLKLDELLCVLHRRRCNVTFAHTCIAMAMLKDILCSPNIKILLDPLWSFTVKDAKMRRGNWTHHNFFLPSVFFFFPSLIDRRGFLPADESVQTAGTDIELPTLTNKSEINVVGGSSQLVCGLQDSPSLVPAPPNSLQISSSAWQSPYCLL